MSRTVNINEHVIGNETSRNKSSCSRYLPLFWPVWQSGAAVEHNLCLSQNTPISWYTYLCIVICISTDALIEKQSLNFRFTKETTRSAHSCTSYLFALNLTTGINFVYPKIILPNSSHVAVQNGILLCVTLYLLTCGYVLPLEFPKQICS